MFTFKHDKNYDNYLMRDSNGYCQHGSEKGQTHQTDICTSVYEIVTDH